MIFTKATLSIILAVFFIAGATGGYVAGAMMTSAKVEIKEVAIPSNAETFTAWNIQRLRNPLGYNEWEKPDNTIALGDCAPSTIMSGVMCMATIQKNPQASPFNRNVNFARNAEGTWVATRM